jgi:hypothetical protein
MQDISDLDEAAAFDNEDTKGSVFSDSYSAADRDFLAMPPQRVLELRASCPMPGKRNAVVAVIEYPQFSVPKAKVKERKVLVHVVNDPDYVPGMQAKTAATSSSSISTSLQPALLSQITVQPFVRKAFPRFIRPRSLIAGASCKLLLRTCFRVGEAFRISVQAEMDKQDIIMELYAKVLFSERTSANQWKQSFQFGDIFTDKSPTLNGVYEKFRNVGLWDHETKQLIGDSGQGKIVRVIGKMTRTGRNNNSRDWMFNIDSIWESDKDDVQYVREIVEA